MGPGHIYIYEKMFKTNQTIRKHIKAVHDRKKPYKCQYLIFAS